MSERRDDLQGFKDVCCSSQTLPGTALTRPKRNVVWLKWEPTGHHSNKEKTGLRVPKIPFTHWKETLSHPVLVVILLQQRAVMGTPQHSQQSLLPLWYKTLVFTPKNTEAIDISQRTRGENNFRPNFSLTFSFSSWTLVFLFILSNKKAT